MSIVLNKTSGFFAIPKSKVAAASAKAKVAAAFAIAAASISSAQAAVPANVTTALTDLQTDALTVAGVVLAAIVAVYAFKFIRKGL